MPKKKRKKARDDKIIELGKSKSKKEEEKFFVTFSTTQQNAVLLIILASTFLIQGIVRYFELIDRIDLIRPWFLIVLYSLVFLAISVLTISLSNISGLLKYKRIFNAISFLLFIVGFSLFGYGLIFLLMSL